MGLLMKIFTWWEGATIGTALWTSRKGAEVGQDSLGNRYYEAKAADPALGYKRRWVIYAGANDSSNVPPEWHGWLHHQVAETPDVALPAPRAWQKEARPNLTGTEFAYRPAGSLDAGGRRQAATGDYEAWVPN